MIDSSRLPERALLDTPVVIRALLGQRVGDPRTPNCVQFVEAMLAKNRQLLVSAPTIAEIVRGDAAARVPNRKGIEVVSFDHRAAVMLGTTFPARDIRQRADEEGIEREVIYFDALIVSCAVRHRADAVITLDKGRYMKTLGARSPVPILNPSEFVLPIIGVIEQSKALDEQA